MGRHVGALSPVHLVADCRSHEVYLEGERRRGCDETLCPQVAEITRDMRRNLSSTGTLLFYGHDKVECFCWRASVTCLHGVPALVLLEEGFLLPRCVRPQASVDMVAPSGIILRTPHCISRVWAQDGQASRSALGPVHNPQCS